MLNNNKIYRQKNVMNQKTNKKCQTEKLTNEMDDWQKKKEEQKQSTKNPMRAMSKEKRSHRKIQTKMIF